MGGQKDFGLHRYAATFAEAGFAVFLFDYRTFGGSDGQPRNWVSPSRQLQDWRSALSYINTELTSKVDVSKLFLWGTSFAGGHVLVLSSEMGPNVTAVIAQVPNLDARTSTKASIKSRGIPKSLRMFAAGVHDLIRTAAGQPSVYLPLAGPPGSLAFMQLTDEEMYEYSVRKPDNKLGGWRNMARAAYVLEHAVLQYSPIKYVSKIQAPVLYVAATKDILCPYEAIHKAAALTKHAEILAKDCNHFELSADQYFGPLMEQQVAFLMQNMKPKSE